MDELQEELNKKNEESNTLQLILTGISENMEKKIEENKELLLKLSSLEERNMNLEQELSVYRVSQCDMNKDDKSAYKDTSENTTTTCDFTYI